jgi:hypothetical protein
MLTADLNIENHDKNTNYYYILREQGFKFYLAPESTLFRFKRKYFLFLFTN